MAGPFDSASRFDVREWIGESAGQNGQPSGRVGPGGSQPGQTGAGVLEGLLHAIQLK